MDFVTYRICEACGLPEMDQLARLLSFDDGHRYDELLQFWKSWFQGDIPGEKATVVASTTAGELVGVMRLWCSPYCDHRWLVEGLGVHPHFRRRGIGWRLLTTGIDYLKAKGIGSLWSHIHFRNIPSIELHKKIGFRPVARGYVNSWGEYRDNGAEYCLKI